MEIQSEARTFVEAGTLAQASEEDFSPLLHCISWGSSVQNVRKSADEANFPQASSIFDPDEQEEGEVVHRHHPHRIEDQVGCTAADSYRIE